MTQKSGNKVLVIDDDETILMLVEQVLDRNSYIPVCVSSGQDGLEKAKEERPDIIVLDRRMPEMDGNETLIQLKLNDSTKDVPVVMLTGDSRLTDVSTSLELGAADYIVKPFEQKDFLARLEKVLAGTDG